MWVAVMEVWYVGVCVDLAVVAMAMGVAWHVALVVPVVFVVDVFVLVDHRFVFMAVLMV
jgi:hypothetical protein